MEGHVYPCSIKALRRAVGRPITLIRVFGLAVGQTLTLVLMYLSYCRHHALPSRALRLQSVSRSALPWSLVISGR